MFKIYAVDFDVVSGMLKGTLSDAKKFADDNCAFTEKDLVIVDTGISVSDYDKLGDKSPWGLLSESPFLTKEPEAVRYWVDDYDEGEARKQFSEEELKSVIRFGKGAYLPWVDW